MEVSYNGGIPKSSILYGFAIANHPGIGNPPLYGNLRTCMFQFMFLARIGGFYLDPTCDNGFETWQVPSK